MRFDFLGPSAGQTNENGSAVGEIQRVAIALLLRHAHSSTSTRLEVPRPIAGTPHLVAPDA